MADQQEDTSAQESDEDNGYYLDEIIESEKKLEEDARAVLGGSDPHRCTYNQGYIVRQALYACATCIQSPEESAGVCLACSLECHDGHQLFELYTKRRFRCDCGNSKFTSSCKLTPDKESVNIKNKYGQNFKGLYCTCHRPYPDPENEEEGEMIQCVICEDWYHDIHLKLSTPVPTDYSEMICFNCAKKQAFLLSYPELSVTEDLVDVTGSVDSSLKSEREDSQSAGDKSLPSVSQPSEGAGSSSEGCSHLAYNAAVEKTLFMADDWRKSLCVCSECAEYYKSCDLEFLLDPEDPTHVYEEKSEAATEGPSSYDKALGAMSNLGRTQQVELLHGYNDLKENLADFLKKLAEKRKIVKAEDIKEFFDEYKSSKRPKYGAPPSNCS